jgi:hypothetical protein
LLPKTQTRVIMRLRCSLRVASFRYQIPTKRYTVEARLCDNGLLRRDAFHVRTRFPVLSPEIVPSSIIQEGVN